jgi:hypothetical protein
MKTFSISAGPGVTVFDSRAEAEARGITPDELFETEEQLTGLVGSWPGARLVGIWNGLPGVKPVRRFSNRQIGVQRIWRAVQSLGASPACDSSRPKINGTTRAKAAVRREAERGSKRDCMLALLRQPGGATLQALMQATGWQAHSIRGFISGTLTKRMGLKIESFKRDRERVYALGC